MFNFNEPYKQSLPEVIHDDFASLLTEEMGMDAQTLLNKLACYISTDTLRDFMDDLAMDRV